MAHPSEAWMLTRHVCCKRCLHRFPSSGSPTSSQAAAWISRAGICFPTRLSTSVTVSSTGLTLAGAGRGSRGSTDALRNNSLWSAPRRTSSTPARGFERAPFSSKRFERAPLSMTQSAKYEPLSAASEFVSATAHCKQWYPSSVGPGRSTASKEGRIEPSAVHNVWAGHLGEADIERANRCRPGRDGHA